MIKFEEMGFAPGILKAIQELGFEYPMPVQEKVIPEMLTGERDIIALAQTGTGKTAAFGLPLVQATELEIGRPGAVILCPTRELCIQITGDMSDFAKFTGKLRVLPVYGGTSIENQIRELKKGVHIIVATPGRLIDLINRGAANLSFVSTVILDEADEMLNMGFIDSINEILEQVPEGRRTLLFSATMSSEIASIANRYMNNPVEITIGKKNSSADNVSHFYYLVHAKDKYRLLKRIADSETEIYSIIFCRTRKETHEVASKLIHDGYNADALHGDLSQSQRDTVMQKFRQKNLNLLVATDVAARGLDMDDITHVINFSLPDDIEVYTHRSGRTGRAGKRGISISIVHIKEMHNLHKIVKLIKKPVKALPIPTSSEICGKQLFNWVSKLETAATDHKEIEKLLPQIKQKLENMSWDKLLRQVVSLEFDRFLDDYRHGENLIEPVNEKKISYAKAGIKGLKEGNNVRFTRLFINIGKSDGLSPEKFIELLNTNTKGRMIAVGRIELLKGFSFFEVEAGSVEYVLKILNSVKFKKRQISVEIAQEKIGPMQKNNSLKRNPADWAENNYAKRKQRTIQDYL
jgi:ATP-dependent RNA helicase DeaD